MKKENSFLRSVMMVAVFASVGYAGAVNSAYSYGNDEFDRPKSATSEYLILNRDSVQEVYVPDDDFIELETSDSTLLCEISNLFVIDNTLYVHSDNCIRVFDFTGEYLYDDVEDDRPVEALDYYQQYDGSSYCMRQSPTNEPCFCQFNISTHQTKMFHFNLKNRNFVQSSFFKIIDGQAYIEFRSVEDKNQNPMFFKLKLSDL